MIDVSVILATYNRAASLKQALDSFSRLRIPPALRWELLVIDNNSKDNTREVVDHFAKLWGPCLHYIFEGTQGKSFALRAGLAQARGAILAFTDDDVTFDPEWLASLTQAFAEFDCAAVGGRVLPVWRQPKPDWLEMEGQQAVVHFDMGNEPRQLLCPPIGANYGFKREMFSRFGPFRLDLGVRGGDNGRGGSSVDTEFASRLLRAGEKIMYIPAATVYHPVEPHRATKSYFLRWFYIDGVCEMRSAGWPDDAGCLFGIPRYLYRGIAENFLRWIFAFESKRRFHHKVRTYRVAGRMVEARRISLRRKS